MAAGADGQDDEKGRKRKRKRPKRPSSGRRPSGESARRRGLRRIAMIRAIAHPLRRRTLRLLHDSDDVRSPKQIAAALKAGLSSVSYQVSVLRGLGALEPDSSVPVRGAIEHFYRSTIENDRPIEMLLEETRQIDEENARRGYKP